MKAACLVAVLAMSVIPLIGCGDGAADDGGSTKTSTPMRSLGITLEGYASPADAGILVANERGYFEDSGLVVTTFTPTTPLRPVRYVTEHIVDVAISHQPQVAMAVEKGVPIVAVGSLVSEPTASMIWLKKSGIKDVADLKGKTIAYPGLSFQKEFLRTVLGRAGLTLDDVEVKRVDYDLVSSLVSGRADAVFGASANIEGAELEARGLDPVITPVGDLGVLGYEELVVIARRDRLQKDPEPIRAFMSAVRKGTAAATEDPGAVTEAILNGEYEQPERKMTEAQTRSILRAETESTLPLLSPTGEADAGKAERLVAWMHDQGMLQRQPPAPALFTNAYLDRSADAE